MKELGKIGHRFSSNLCPKCGERFTSATSHPDGPENVRYHCGLIIDYDSRGNALEKGQCTRDLRAMLRILRQTINNANVSESAKFNAHTALNDTFPQDYEDVSSE